MLEIINLLDDGPVPYERALALQQERVIRRQQNLVPDALFLLEHPPTVTYGRAADTAAHLRLSFDAYRRRGISLVPTNRGGDVTYHGPGQLIGYPVVFLGAADRDLHRYIRTLETILIAACWEMGASSAGTAPWHAGVWANGGYLAALGVRVSRWVAYHGFALNITEQVRPGFETIVPCGVADHAVVTLETLCPRPVTVAEAADTVSGQFRQFWKKDFPST